MRELFGKMEMFCFIIVVVTQILMHMDLNSYKCTVKISQLYFI